MILTSVYTEWLPVVFAKKELSKYKLLGYVI